MPVVKLSLSQIATRFKKRPSQIMGAARRGLTSGGMRSLTVLQARTQQRAFNTGALARSWKMSKPDVNSIALFNTRPYAPVVEYGRRPNKRQPPSKVIEMWAKRKLGLSAKEAKRAAFVIARAIGKKGIKGKRILSDSMGEITDLVRQEIIREVRAELKKPTT